MASTAHYTTLSLSLAHTRTVICESEKKLLYLFFDFILFIVQTRFVHPDINILFFSFIRSPFLMNIPPCRTHDIYMYICINCRILLFFFLSKRFGYAFFFMVHNILFRTITGLDFGHTNLVISSIFATHLNRNIVHF